ncbi:hypothetical protein C3L33_17130, partial [Rhododendron williamsianum]
MSLIASSLRKPDLVLGFCDGILCLYWRPNSAICSRVGSNVERLPTIALWNPTTRAFSILPVSNFDVPPYRKVAYCMVGFGFDLTMKSIKVVKVVNFHREKVTRNAFINCAEVYKLGSGSWRVLNVDDLSKRYMSQMKQSSACTITMMVFFIGTHSPTTVEAALTLTMYLGTSSFVCMSTELFQLTLLPERKTTQTIEVWVMKDFNAWLRLGNPSPHTARGLLCIPGGPFEQHIAFVLNLDTSSSRYIVGSLESGLGGLDANILSQCAFAVDNLAKPAAPNLTPRVSDCPDVVPKVMHLEYDMLEYVVIERLAQVGREKLKDDGFNFLDTVAKLKIECPSSWMVYVVVEVVFLAAAPTIL